MNRITDKKHLILAALLLFLGFVATSVANYTVSLYSLRKEIVNNDLPLTGDTVYSEIRRDLLIPVFISSSMAHDTFVRDWVLDGERDPYRMTRYLKEIQIKFDAITAFFVSNKTEIYYHADGILKRVSPDAERDVWFYRVKKMGNPYEINVDIDMANDDAMTIFINYKVFDYDGNFIGATGIGLTVNAVTKLIAQYRERYDREIYFTDGEGTITLRASDDGTDGRKTLFDRLERNEMAREILSRREDVPISRTFDRKGHTIHLDSRYIPEFDWYLFVEQNEDDVTKAIRHTLAINILVGGLITLVVTSLVALIVRNYERRVERLASVDELTGMWNRRAFDLAFAHLLEKFEGQCSVTMMDIDHFKHVNDTYGHLMGDRVLGHVCDVVTKAIGPDDVCGRWGGEEFIVLLKGRKKGDAVKTAEKIRRAVEASPYEDGDVVLPITVSLGVAEHHPGESRETTIARADQALYRAKESGRNRTESA
ncbi:MULTISPECIES: sensor domain-containing diguanylate cyclase [Dethiosulfovibrio]|uniref:Diguanylate cyclase n=2 Tax=Dethiosulfovibrio TaxID=47054 RepID=A0ABS9EP92_9BACT|nr:MULTISPECIES: diguanylate cyclase [Dethiosulfovibrio]MCF4113267.1 diguanylate cyclase [Dethiosulfovibrio russensis]MCF4142331.1 diguanylate cyclase [Dethiosulfovibrio marinus]MCF4144639.1 diguanylate cyclase [Dethiosulfovibrio acidaminovorans]